MTPKGYVLIMTVQVNPTVRNERENPRRLHRDSGEAPMAGGETSSTTNADTAFRTTPLETNSTGMKYRLSRTRSGTRTGMGSTSRRWPPWWHHGRRDWSSPIRRSRESTTKKRAREVRAAHRESGEDVRGVQEGSEGVWQCTTVAGERKRAWVSEIRAIRYQNKEMRAPTVLVSHGEAHGCVGDFDLAPEQWIVGRRCELRCGQRKGREGGVRL